MIPLKLTIEGLYSYRTSQTIDFTNLTQSGLFGIFGGVGSGKSSILEAISFALYGESERLNSRDKRNYNMMNLKSKKLLIDFEFKSHNETIYKFIVQGKRNNIRFEEVGAFERKAFRFENEEWVPISTNEIETITGLNYQNFRRTIIIPQGRFQEFLQLSSTDRTTMLKELFNLSKYELSDKIGRLDARNDKAIQFIEGEMKGIGEVNTEMITELEIRKGSLLAEKVVMSTNLATKEKADQEAESLKKLVCEIAGKKTAQAELKRSEGAMKELEIRVKEYDLLFKLFKADATQFEGLQEQFGKSGKDLAIQQTNLADLQKKAIPVRIRFDELKDAYGNKDHLLAESEDTKKYAEVKKTLAYFEILQKNGETAGREIERLTGLVAAGKITQEKINVELGNLRQNLPDYKILSDVKAWFSEMKRLTKFTAENLKKSGEQEVLLKNLNSHALTEINRSGLFETMSDDVDTGKILIRIDTSKTELQGKLTRVELQIAGLEVQKRLEDFAADLHDGKPCPLCGSENHPHKINSTDVDSDIARERTTKKSLEALVKKCIELERALTGIQVKQDAVAEQTAELLNGLNLLRIASKEHEDAFCWAMYEKNNEAKVTEAESQYEIITKSISSLEKEIKNVIHEVEEQGKLLEKQQTEINQIEIHKVAAHTTVDMLEDQIDQHSMEKYDALSFEQLLEKSQELASQHTALTQNYLTTEKELNSINIAIGELNGTIGAMERNHTELENQVKILRQKIDDKLLNHGKLEYSHVLSVLKHDMDVDKERATLEEFNQSLMTISKMLAELERELANRPYDEDAHQMMKEEIHAMKLSVEGINRNIGGLESAISTMKNNQVKYEHLKREMHQKELRRQDITELKNLFRSNGFVNYVSTVHLQNLCKAANERFYKLTRQKLGLELAEDNSFEIRDYMNDGRLRNVKTLSGGQTFQASLSLALSLADSIHKLAASSENFFFLDEGFGTLDKETLEVAFDTLKSLRKENRIVGVISHVEEMQTEIETFLKVINDEDRGSIVMGSWER